MTLKLVRDVPPADIPAAVREVKVWLRRRIGDYVGVFADVEAAMRREVADVVTARRRDEEVWPAVRFADIISGAVPPETVDAIRRRGCAVVIGTFPRERAEGWDGEFASSPQDNGCSGSLVAAGAAVSTELVAARHASVPASSSRPQMQARHDPNMAAVHAFLNSFWKRESEGRVWFDRSRETVYPDGVLRRAPGSTLAGVPPHIDSGSIERWLLPAYQSVFRHVFSGDWADYDPWDGAYRTEVEQYPLMTTRSAFRTFHGWTALSYIRRGEGALNVVPIPSAIVYVLLRVLQDDIADDDLCGAARGEALIVDQRHHAVLLPALSPVPDLAPGDTIWWHADAIHSVKPFVA